MKKIGHFAICQAIAEAHGDIRFSDINENLVSVRKVKAGTQVTIGVAGDLVAALGITNKFVGGLLLIDRQEYFATKKRLEADE